VADIVTFFFLHDHKVNPLLSYRNELIVFSEMGRKAL
jgi:hypothetical protein